MAVASAVGCHAQFLGFELLLFVWVFVCLFIIVIFIRFDAVRIAPEPLAAGVFAPIFRFAEAGAEAEKSGRKHSAFKLSPTIFNLPLSECMRIPNAIGDGSGLGSGHAIFCSFAFPSATNEKCQAINYDNNFLIEVAVTQVVNFSPLSKCHGLCGQKLSTMERESGGNQTNSNISNEIRQASLNVLTDDGRNKSMSS